MNKKFYVYKIKVDGGDNRLAFIEDDKIDDFTFNVFDPARFEFMDVCIQAPDAETAKSIYSKPYDTPEGCEYLHSNEPQMPAAKRVVVEKQRERHKLNQEVSYVELQQQAHATQKTVSTIARRLYSESNKVLKPKQIYGLLMKNYAATLTRLPYLDDNDDSGTADSNIGIKV